MCVTWNKLTASINDIKTSKHWNNFKNKTLKQHYIESQPFKKIEL
jgi:hypothetical protein